MVVSGTQLTVTSTECRVSPGEGALRPAWLFAVEDFGIASRALKRDGSKWFLLPIFTGKQLAALACFGDGKAERAQSGPPGVYSRRWRNTRCGF